MYFLAASSPSFFCISVASTDSVEINALYSSPVKYFLISAVSKKSIEKVTSYFLSFTSFTSLIFGFSNEEVLISFSISANFFFASSDKSVDEKLAGVLKEDSIASHIF